MFVRVKWIMGSLDGLERGTGGQGWGLADRREEGEWGILLGG